MIRGYQDKVSKRFVREIAEVTEFYVDPNNIARSNTIYKKDIEGRQFRNQPTKYLIDYLEGQGITLDNQIQVNNQNVQPMPQFNNQPRTVQVNQSMSQPNNQMQYRQVMPNGNQNMMNGNLNQTNG